MFCYFQFESHVVVALDQRAVKVSLCGVDDGPVEQQQRSRFKAQPRHCFAQLRHVQRIKSQRVAAKKHFTNCYRTDVDLKKNTAL